MVAVTRLDKQLMYLNPDHIIFIEETPDTVITLFNGNRYIVVDRAAAIISRIVAFRAKISRRAAGRSAKKYLGRVRSGQFHHSAVTMPDESFSDHQSKQNHIPLHGRYY